MKLRNDSLLHVLAAAGGMGLVAGCGGGGQTAAEPPYGTIRVAIAWPGVERGLETPADGATTSRYSTSRAIPAGTVAIRVRIVPDGGEASAVRESLVVRPASDVELGFVKLGPATLEASAYDDAAGVGNVLAEGSKQITVVGGANPEQALFLYEEVTQLLLTPAADTIAVNDSATLTVRAYDRNGTEKPVPPARWNTDSGSVVNFVRVGPNGMARILDLTGVGEGSALVQVSCMSRGNTLYAFATVTVRGVGNGNNSGSGGGSGGGGGGANGGSSGDYGYHCGRHWIPANHVWRRQSGIAACRAPLDR